MGKNNNNKLVILAVLDGWGLFIPNRGNAISQAKLPNFNKYWKEYPHTILTASGKAVGLPHRVTGNSEVGHMNLGAGRIVTQDLTLINNAISSGTFFQNPVLLSAIQHARANGSNMHVMGLVSDGNVHSNIRHLFAILKLCKKEKFHKQVYIHCFTDGQDTGNRTAIKYIKWLQEEIKSIGIGKIASISGRYYAMDRAHNYKRNQQVYDLIVSGKGEKSHSAEDVILKSYKKGITDEFIKPTIILDNSNPVKVAKDRDSIVYFNLRSDRARQLTKPFVLYDFDGFKRKEVLHDIFFVGLTNFGDDLPMSIAFPTDRIDKSLPEVISWYDNMKQLYIAEEEKYAHVTYFFHGSSTIPYANEEKIMIDSKSDIKTYDEYPAMSAGKVTSTILRKIKKEKYNFVLVNYANGDMLGHTGNLKATIKGIEYVDKCIGKLHEEVTKQEGSLILTADHGNCDEMIDLETNEIITKHSHNPVPFILADDKNKNKKIPEGILGNVAPTIIELLGIDAPHQMNQESLI